uniref:cDNA FLJ52750, highly similar to Rho guanine nucleotide exchange factor 7 n=1 Tax=Homo sapiens TaxID=9606 RepID=B7Z6D9_HUMAN|nr:unnamed protein product [Homo sapiens]
MCFPRSSVTTDDHQLDGIKSTRAPAPGCCCCPSETLRSGEVARSSAESRRLLFKPDATDENPVPHVLCQSPFCSECPHGTQDYHTDRQDIQKSMAAFKNLSAQCQEVRKRKELELQILTEAIRNWEGDDIKTLGNVTYMSQVLIQCAGSEEKNERYLLLFPNVLLMLSASPRMSGFIYQGA